MSSSHTTASIGARFLETVRSSFAPLSGVYVLVGIIVVFSILRPEVFATSQNAQIIITGQAVAAILACALILPLSAEILDISVAATMGLAVITIGWLQSNGIHPLLSIILTLSVGLLVGLANSLSIIAFKVPPLIATLAMASILGAIAYKISDGQGIYEGIDEGYAKLGQLAPLGIPSTVLFLMIITLVLYYIVEHTPFGRQVRALGSNPDAARLAGLRVNRLTVLVLISSSTLATLAGLIYTARLGTAPLHAGEPYLLSSFAAVFLGFTQIRSGRFNVFGTLVAIYLLATGVNGIQFLYPGNPWIKSLFEGLALILAVALSVRERRAPPSSASDEDVHKERVDDPAAARVSVPSA